MNCARLVLFVTNFVIFFAALAIVGFALYVFIDSNDVAGLLEGAHFRIFTLIFLGVAGAVMLMAFAGCCGAWKKQKCLLMFYIVLLTVVVILEVGTAVVIIYYGADIEDQTKDWLKDSMKEYKEDDAVKEAWDQFQEKFSCCSVDDPAQWVTIAGMTEAPNSCCRDYEKEGDTCIADPANYHEDGCYEKVLAEIEDQAKILAGAAAALVGIQVLSLILACCALNSYRKKTEYA